MYFTRTNETLCVILEGREQITALKAKVAIPKTSIISMSWHDVFKDWRTWEVRMPGSYLPKWIMAGSFWTEEGWDFVYGRRPRGVLRPELHKVLVIETDMKKFKRVIIGTGKKDAAEIIDWWKAGAKAK